MEHKLDLEYIRHTAEDGLDPSDGLTAREALARILCEFAGAPKNMIYEPGGTDPEGGWRGRHIIRILLDWSHGAKDDRKILERAELISRWEVSS